MKADTASLRTRVRDINTPLSTMVRTITLKTKKETTLEHIINQQYLTDNCTTPLPSNHGIYCLLKCMISLVFREMQAKVERYTNSYQLEYLEYRKEKATSVGKDVEESEPSFIVGGKCKMVQPYWKMI